MLKDTNNDDGGQFKENAEDIEARLREEYEDRLKQMMEEYMRCTDEEIENLISEAVVSVERRKEIEEEVREEMRMKAATEYSMSGLSQERKNMQVEYEEEMKREFSGRLAETKSEIHIMLKNQYNEKIRDMEDLMNEEREEWQIKIRELEEREISLRNIQHEIVREYEDKEEQYRKTIRELMERLESRDRFDQRKEDSQRKENKEEMTLAGVRSEILENRDSRRIQRFDEVVNEQGSGYNNPKGVVSISSVRKGNRTSPPGSSSQRYNWTDVDHHNEEELDRGSNEGNGEEEATDLMKEYVERTEDKFHERIDEVPFINIQNQIDYAMKDIPLVDYNIVQHHIREKANKINEDKPYHYDPFEIKQTDENSEYARIIVKERMHKLKEQLNSEMKIEVLSEGHEHNKKISMKKQNSERFTLSKEGPIEKKRIQNESEEKAASKTYKDPGESQSGLKRFSSTKKMSHNTKPQNISFNDRIDLQSVLNSSKKRTAQPEELPIRHMLDAVYEDSTLITDEKSTQMKSLRHRIAAFEIKDQILTPKYQSKLKMISFRPISIPASSNHNKETNQHEYLVKLIEMLDELFKQMFFTMSSRLEILTSIESSDSTSARISKVVSVIDHLRSVGSKNSDLITLMTRREAVRVQIEQIAMNYTSISSISKFNSASSSAYKLLRSVNKEILSFFHRSQTGNKPKKSVPIQYYGFDVQDLISCDFWEEDHLRRVEGRLKAMRK